MSQRDGPFDAFGNPLTRHGMPGEPLPPRVLAPGQLLEPDGDRIYGHRSRSFQDPFPAWNPNITDIIVQASVVLVANTANQLVCRYQPARGRVAYIQGFGQDALCGAFSDVVWRVKVGARVWITSQIGQIGSFASPFRLHLPVVGGNVVTIEADCGATARTISGMLSGVEKPVETGTPEQA